jgi:hypothetical protein
VAKPELLFHVKLGRLQRTLGIRKYEAVGILECVWQHCWGCATEAVGTAADLAWIVEWPTEDADRLADGLAACGFLDPDPAVPGSWLVHECWRHAPQYARLRRAREIQIQQDFNLRRAIPVPDRTDPRAEEQRLTPPSHPVDACGNLHVAPAPDDEGPGPDVEPVNPRVLARLCYELGLEDCETWADAAEALKCLSARYRVPYTGPAITRAITKVGYARATSPLAPLVRARGT